MITGPAGDAQGWGDLSVTENVCQAMEALNCMDHVRADMRLDALGNLKRIEVNGIPELKHLKSWSPQMFTMQHPSEQGPMEDYRRLINHVVTSAMARYGLI